MRKTVTWSGVFPAVTTQFRDDFTVDHAFAYRQILYRVDDFRETRGQFILISR